MTRLVPGQFVLRAGMGACRIFCMGATGRSGGRKSPSEVQGRSPGAGLGLRLRS